MSSNESTCLFAVSGKTQLVESKVGFDEKFLANNSALSLGRARKEKEEFYILGNIMKKNSETERLFVCGDFNWHVGAASCGFKEALDGMGFYIRNSEGEMLEFYKKKFSIKQLMSQVGLRHKLTVLNQKARPKIAPLKLSMCRICKFKEVEVSKYFEKKLEARKVIRLKRGVESVWKNTKKCFLEVADEVCGRTMGPQQHKESWWWKKEVTKVVEEKRKLYNMWKKSGNDENRSCIVSLSTKPNKLYIKLSQR
ncbi:uncharacterized protein LOC136092076 [Hydra vulgaris]|uniref:Uncharacterized protein LOC136092076 n=1 Tax=Hydra vulgaris TaxID=6087 RepID=A0ABM4DMS2_HYDVU